MLCLVDIVLDFSLLFQVLNKPHMLKVRVVRSETAMTDVIREVSNKSINTCDFAILLWHVQSSLGK